MTDKKVMTIQDISCVGQCSITVAHPIISACGVETAILPSAVLSTHTGGFTGFTFRDLADDIPEISAHWQKEKIVFDCVYSGYLGSEQQIGYVKDLFRDVLKEGGLKVVDPAMADHGKLYYGFDESFAASMAGLCGEADIILPNITEACFMTGLEYREDHHDETYVRSILSALKKTGVGKIVLKGVSYTDDRLGVIVYDCGTDELKPYFTAKEPKNYHGTGDCYAAAFVGAVMQGKTIYDAACLAADFVVECIRNTVDDDTHWYGVKFERVLPMLVDKLNK